MKIQIVVVIIDAKRRCLHNIQNQDDIGFSVDDIPQSSVVDADYPVVVMMITETDTETTICERALKILGLSNIIA